MGNARTAVLLGALAIGRSEGLFLRMIGALRAAADATRRKWTFSAIALGLLTVLVILIAWTWAPASGPLFVIAYVLAIVLLANRSSLSQDRSPPDFSFG